MLKYQKYLNHYTKASFIRNNIKINSNHVSGLFSTSSIAKEQNKLFFIIPSKTKKENSHIQENSFSPTIEGTDSFINTYEILNDREYIYNLFKQTHSQKLITDFENLQKEKNQHDLILYLKYLETKDYKLFLNWLKSNQQNFSKKYVLNILDYIVNNINLQDTTFDELEIILEIYIKFFHKNLNFLNFLEKKIIKNFNEIDSIYVSLVINNFIKLNYKTNDELFGELISKYPMCNFQKFNYNSVAIFMQNYSKFSFTKIYTWRYLELSLIKIMNSLYKSRTLERILEAMIFANKNFGINLTIIDIIKKNLLSKLYSFHLTKIELVEMTSLIEGKYVTDKFVINSIQKIILKSNFSDLNEYGYLIRSFKNLKNILEEKNEIPVWKSFLNKTLSEVIVSMSGEDLFILFEMINESKLSEFFDFRIFKIEFLEKMTKANFSYSIMLNVIYEIWENFAQSETQQNGINLHFSMIKKFDFRKFLIRDEFYSISKNEIFLNLCNFLFRYHLVRNEFYVTVEKYFVEMLKEKLNSNFDDFKIAILTIPLYYNFSESSASAVLESIKNSKSRHSNEFLLRLDYNKSISYKENLNNTNNLNESESYVYDDEIVMRKIFINEKILNLLDSRTDENNIIDLDGPKSKILKEIKDYSNFSYSQMESLYKCKFISSEFENFQKYLK